MGCVPFNSAVSPIRKNCTNVDCALEIGVQAYGILVHCIPCPDVSERPAMGQFSRAASSRSCNSLFRLKCRDERTTEVSLSASDPPKIVNPSLLSSLYVELEKARRAPPV